MRLDFRETVDDDAAAAAGVRGLYANKWPAERVRKPSVTAVRSITKRIIAVHSAAASHKRIIIFSKQYRGGQAVRIRRVYVNEHAK